MTAFCCNCAEDFPLADRGARIQMGLLFPLATMPRRLRDRFAPWKDDEDGAFLCGNCYFDMTDYD